MLDAIFEQPFALMTNSPEHDEDGCDAVTPKSGEALSLELICYELVVGLSSQLEAIHAVSE